MKNSPFLLSNLTCAFVLAGGRGSRLGELTNTTAKPAVHFGGQMRIIDFALSNAVNSGVRKIAVATQYRAHSLIRHCTSVWNFLQQGKNEFLDFLPVSPRSAEGSWYKGTADAVFQNIDIVDDYGIEYALILAGDHIYKMDYAVMLREHIESGANMTVACLEVDRSLAIGFGVMGIDAEGWVRKFDEKPVDPLGTPDDPNKSLVSMGIYIFEWKRLRALLIEDAMCESSHHDFGQNIIPRAIEDGRVRAHRFSESCVSDGGQVVYWRDVGTLDAYWQANIDMTDFTPELNLYSNRWPIWTVNNNEPPAKIIHDIDRRQGFAVCSLIGNGCIVSGSEVRRSLLSTGVRTYSYSMIEDCVINPYAVVNRYAKLRRVIVDGGVEIPKGLIVGYDREEDERWFHVTQDGVVLVTQSMLDEREKDW